MSTHLPAASASVKRQISIIIPTLDEAGTISAILRTLASARRRGTEIIVVDGGSTDDTPAMARPLADRVLHASRVRASQLNADAAVASGDLLLFLHADSQPPEEADTAVLEAIGDRRHAWGRFDVSIASKRPTLRLVARMMNLRSRATGIATGDQGIFATRTLFEQVGRFPQQPLMEDIAFCQRARRISPPVNLRQRIVTSARRWERHGVVRTILLMWRLRLAYYLGADPRRLSTRYDQAR